MRESSIWRPASFFVKARSKDIVRIPVGREASLGRYTASTLPMNTAAIRDFSKHRKPARITTSRILLATGFRRGTFSRRSKRANCWTPRRPRSLRRAYCDYAGWFPIR